MTTPTPTPYPSDGGIADAWQCDNGAPLQTCAVQHYAIVPTATPYAGGYAPGDTGNWSDIGPWFAALLAAVVIGPFALYTFLNWIKEVMQHV